MADCRVYVVIGVLGVLVLVVWWKTRHIDMDDDSKYW